MIVVKIWCLPPNQTEESLRELVIPIVAATKDIPELKIGLKDVVCLFPSGLGLGDEIVIEISGLAHNLSYAEVICQKLAKSVGEMFKVVFPNSKIRSFVEAPTSASGFWSSEFPS